jgi:hypothetical protein
VLRAARIVVIDNEVELLESSNRDSSWKNLTALMHSIYHTWLIQLESLMHIMDQAALFWVLLDSISSSVSSAK